MTMKQPVRASQLGVRHPVPGQIIKKGNNYWVVFRDGSAEKVKM